VFSFRVLFFKQKLFFPRILEQLMHFPASNGTKHFLSVHGLWRYFYIDGVTECNSNSATESSFTLVHYASINLFVYNWE